MVQVAAGESDEARNLAELSRQRRGSWKVAFTNKPVRRWVSGPVPGPFASYALESPASRRLTLRISECELLSALADLPSKDSDYTDDDIAGSSALSIRPSKSSTVGYRALFR